MSMRIHACRPSLAAGGSEPSRRHNKFKREVRARAAPKRCERGPRQTLCTHAKALALLVQEEGRAVSVGL